MPQLLPQLWQTVTGSHQLLIATQSEACQSKRLVKPPPVLQQRTQQQRQYRSKRGVRCPTNMSCPVIPSCGFEALLQACFAPRRSLRGGSS